MSGWISHSGRHLWPVFCLWTSVACCGSASAATQQQASAPATLPALEAEPFDRLLLQIDINRQGIDRVSLILRDKGGELYMAEQDWNAWRLVLPQGRVIAFEGARYYPLSAVPTERIMLDEAKQSLALELKPEAFTAAGIDVHARQIAAPVKPQPGMFLNYDLFAQRSGGAAGYSGSLEAGFFNSIGSAVSGIALQNNGQAHRAVRLDTTLAIDQPENIASLRLGDSISRPAAVWGNAWRFGGIQYATNFNVRPGLITVPMQSFGGQAALPSTVDVFVNNALAMRKEVPPGPFSISNLPVISGSGDVSMVVRDISGREQVITQPFYASPSLLRKGLADFSTELGALRRNYGLASNDYGPLFGSGTYRLGLSDALTAEAHAQWQAGGRGALGLNAVGLVAPLGTFNASIAESRGDAGNGQLWGVGFNRQSPIASFGVQTRDASEHFRQIGDDGALAARRITSANAGLGTGQGGSIGAFYLRQDTPGKERAELAGLNYSIGLGRMGMLSVSGFKSLSGAPSHAISISWVVPFGDRITSSLTRSVAQGGLAQTQLQLQRGLPSADGYGYRLQTGDNVPQQAELLMQNRVGNYAIEAASYQGSTALRASLSGGVAVLGGHAFLSRRINDSFGLVQLPGMPNVDVYVDNQLTARTDENGNAVLPRLRAYDSNPVRIEQSQLRLDTQIETLQMNAVPYARSGVVLRFPIRRARRADAAGGGRRSTLAGWGDGQGRGTEGGLSGGDEWDRLYYGYG